MAYLSIEDRKIAIYFGLLSFFHVSLHNVYLLYHVSIFTKFYKISTSWFWTAEFVFVIWNSLNDTIFGFYVDSDEIIGTAEDRRNNIECAMRRIKSLSFHGPAFCLSFSLFWYPFLPGWPGIQLIITLCLYDAFLTMLDLNQHALLSELAENIQHRVSMARFTSLFSVLGTFPLFILQTTWTKEVNSGKPVPSSFSQLCFIFAIIAFFGYYFTARRLYDLAKLKTHHLPNYYTTKKRYSDPSLKWGIHQNSKVNVLERSRRITGYIHQLWRRGNFRIYAAVNLIQTLHCHFNSNYFPLFLGVLFHDEQMVPASWLLVISFILPHVINLYNLKLVERHGSYQVITMMFMLKILAGVVLFFATVNRENLENINSFGLLILLVGYMVFNRVLTEGVCKLLSLPLADLCDEDRMLRGRNASAALSGTISLFGKPGQSLAPLIGHFLLSDKDSKESIIHVMYLVPITIGVLQCILWSQYNLSRQKERAFL